MWLKSVWRVGSGLGLSSSSNARLWWSNMFKHIQVGLTIVKHLSVEKETISQKLLTQRCPFFIFIALLFKKSVGLCWPASDFDLSSSIIISFYFIHLDEKWNEWLSIQSIFTGSICWTKYNFWFESNAWLVIAKIRKLITKNRANSLPVSVQFQALFIRVFSFIQQLRSYSNKWHGYVLSLQSEFHDHAYYCVWIHPITLYARKEKQFGRAGSELRSSCSTRNSCNL